MTTDESTPTFDATISSQKQRSVNDIAKAGTFQGFTDDEIQAYVDFYVGLSQRDAKAKAWEAAYITEMNERSEVLQQQSEDSRAALHALLNLPLELGTIDENGEVSS